MSVCAIAESPLTAHQSTTSLHGVVRLCVQYYKAWVTLYNPAKDAAQGKVRVSVTILEPGDELPPRPGRECPEEAGQPQNFDLHFRCFCAEGLPQMDRTGLADPYVSLIWRDKKTRTPELSNTLTPEFFQELTLPVQIEIGRAHV